MWQEMSAPLGIVVLIMRPHEASDENETVRLITGGATACEIDVVSENVSPRMMAGRI